MSRWDCLSDIHTRCLLELRLPLAFAPRIVRCVCAFRSPFALLGFCDLCILSIKCFPARASPVLRRSDHSCSVSVKWYYHCRVPRLRFLVPLFPFGSCRNPRRDCSEPSRCCGDCSDVIVSQSSGSWCCSGFVPTRILHLTAPISLEPYFSMCLRFPVLLCSSFVTSNAIMLLAFFDRALAAWCETSSYQRLACVLSCCLARLVTSRSVGRMLAAIPRPYPPPISSSLRCAGGLRCGR